ncbi:hypothetical protein Mgra_00009993 [Meloidogyne graminicola]|uniref:Uncharacterized protein n=1 Tax=Meloidogyne graminicola TaxID=189291 RepID=A0A8S9ZAU2_9BILA|nr:hypothetical protein Mgra_00009993 [Meloidogyne graminicola]
MFQILLQKQRVIRWTFPRNIECFAEVLLKEANSALLNGLINKILWTVPIEIQKYFQCVTQEVFQTENNLFHLRNSRIGVFLLSEARYWRLTTVEKIIREAMNSSSTSVSTITIGYHGTLTAGRGVFGKARACREVLDAF